MDIKTRVRNILLTPNTEWPAIAEEPTQVGDVVTGYVMPLAAIGAIAGFIGGSLVGMSLPFLGTYRVPIMTGLAGAVFTFVFAIIGVFILAFIINALAPTFGAQKDSNRLSRSPSTRTRRRGSPARCRFCLRWGFLASSPRSTGCICSTSACRR